MKKLIFVLVLILGVYEGYHLYRFLSPDTQGSPKFYFIEVKSGTKLHTIAQKLETENIISNRGFFQLYAKLSRKAGQIKAGEYRVSNHMSPREILSILCSGISYGIPMTVPEGYSLNQIAQVLEKFRAGSSEEFFRLVRSRKFINTLGIVQKHLDSLEGYLFPDTYLISKNASVEEVVRTMVKRYHEVFNESKQQRAQEIHMTPHEVLTMASVVEKETGAPQERPMIASVFFNRLKKKMKLQSDPTVIYGIRDYDGNITKKDLERVTPYNTYKIAALPPGPICSPGKEAIEAVLYPAQSEFLYFVSHNDGTHEFTKTFEDHRKAVEKFQLDRKAREGKSWRDLKKRNQIENSTH